MTSPFAFLDKDEPQQSSPFSFLDEKKDQGVFSYLGNLAHNFGLAIAAQGYNTNDPVISPMADLMFRNNASERAQIQTIRENLKAANLTSGEAWDRVKEDLTPKNFFSKIGDVAGELVQNPASMISGLPQAIASTVGSPLEAATGLNLGGDVANTLSPEERAAQIKNTAAIVLSSAVGAAARFVTTKALAAEAGVSGVSDLSTASDVALNTISKGGKIGQLGRDILKGGIEAGAAGATFGAVSQANTENQLSGILTGLMFAPIGVAGEMIGSKVRGGDDISRIQKSASNLFLLRQLQYSPDKTIFELTKNLESIATADDLVMAVAKGKMEAGDGHIIVSGVSELKMMDAKAEEVSGGYYRTFGYKRSDGLYDVLFMDDARLATATNAGTKGIFDAQRTFEKTGYLPNEVVSYKGKDYLFARENQFRDQTNPQSTAVLNDPITNKPAHFIPWNEVTRNSVFDLETGSVTINSPLTLKGKLLAVNRGVRNIKGEAGGWSGVGTSIGDAYDIVNPYANHNTLALDNVKTGSPTTFIGMRQSRGQQIIGNGKFYALDPGHLLAYTPSKYEGYSPEIIKGGASPFRLGTVTTAPGRQTIPGILDANLSVNRLTFDNPFVFNGKHYSFSKDIENFYNKYHKGASFEVDKSVNAVSQLGVQWGKIFTPSELRGIVEARKIEQKPIGVPTPQYIKGITPTEEGMKAVTEQDYYSGTYEPYHSPGKTHSESHYAIIDRIVAGAMRRNGYDGFIYRSGGIHNSEIVDIKERGVFNRQDQTVGVTGKASNILDSSKFVDKLYNEFAESTIHKDFVEGTDQPIAFDAAFNDFAKNKGFLPEELPALRRSFEQRIHNEITDALPEGEKQLFKKLQNEITEKENLLFQNGVENLRHSALSNNMYFDEEGAGVIKLRDQDSNKVLGTFHSIQDAQEFVSKSGQSSGINLDGNVNVPPSASAPPQLPPNLGPLNTPPTGWLEKKYALWTTRLSFATANPTIFKNWDVLFKSNLHSNVFNVVDKAAKLADGKKSVYLQRLKIADNTLGKATTAEREHVFNWMETRSIEEHEKAGGPGLRALSPMELALGKQLVPADLTECLSL
jgi:hypothetical protein